MGESSTAVVALATTVHLCLAALRNHRQQPRFVSPLAMVSLALAALPWIFPTLAGLAGGFLFHLAWFAGCEAFGHPVSSSSAVSAAPEMAAAVRPRLPSRPKGFVSAPIIATCDETSDIKTIRILRPEGFDFTAGQFLTVRLRIEGGDYARCYSISSAPESSGYLEISVKRQGLVSSALHAMARPGAMLAVRSPAGAFTYPAGDDRPIVLIGAGVGVTPLISMLRHACASEPNRPVTLIYGVRTESDLAFQDELYAIARRNPQVRVYLAASRGTTRREFYAGRIDQALISMAVPDALQSLAFICGPSAMIDSVRALLSGRGVPDSQIRFERFEAAVAAAARPEADAEAGVAASARAAAHTLICTRSARRVRAEAGQTVLEAAEAAGVEIVSLCRSGICGTCRTQVTDGDARCASTILDEDDRAAGYVLACVTTLHSDCTVNA